MDASLFDDSSATLRIKASLSVNDTPVSIGDPVISGLSADYPGVPAKRRE
jgi:hypothetical protein